MASDHRTGGRLEDHPDQLRAAFGRARRQAANALMTTIAYAAS
jgi:hypothetical protein